MDLNVVATKLKEQLKMLHVETLVIVDTSLKITKFHEVSKSLFTKQRCCTIDLSIIDPSNLEKLYEGKILSILAIRIIVLPLKRKPEEGESNLDEVVSSPKKEKLTTGKGKGRAKFSATKTYPTRSHSKVS